MRKGTIVLSCMLIFTVWNVSARPDEPKYKICFDSGSHNVLQIKKKVIEIYDDLVEQVDESSRMALLKSQTELFELDENTEVFLTSGVLNIVIGDGNGLTLEGTFEKESCEIEVKKHSWLLELLD